MASRRRTRTKRLGSATIGRHRTSIGLVGRATDGDEIRKIVGAVNALIVAPSPSPSPIAQATSISPLFPW